MAQPIYGFGAIAGLAEEVTWATPVDSTHWLPITSHSMQSNEAIADIPYLGVANAQAYPNLRDSVLLAVTAGGGLESWFHYDSKPHLLLLKHAMGGVAKTGSGPYTHTFGLDIDGVVGLTLQTVHGQGITGRAEVWPGCRVNQLVLVVDASGYMRMSASLLAQKSLGSSNLVGTPSYTAAEAVRAGSGSTFDWNGHTAMLQSYRLTIDNNLQRRPIIGSFTSDEFSPGGFASLMSELTLPWMNNDLYDDFRAGVIDDATLVFSGSGSNSMHINMHNTRIVEVGRPVQSPGGLVFTVRARHYDLPGTNQGLAIVVHNANDETI